MSTNKSRGLFRLCELYEFLVIWIHPSVNERNSNISVYCKNIKYCNYSTKVLFKAISTLMLYMYLLIDFVHVLCEHLVDIPLYSFSRAGPNGPPPTPTPH